MIVPTTQEANSSNQVNVTLFNPLIQINGKDADFNKEPLFTYHNTTYVPLRFLSHQLSAATAYDAEFNTLYIDHTESIPQKTKLHASKHEGSFKLSIHSSSPSYAYGQPLNISARLEYTGGSEITISHGIAPISFYIKDTKTEFQSELDSPLIMKKEIYEAEDEYSSTLPVALIQTYNLRQWQKQHTNQPPTDDFLRNNRIAVLPKGEYLIGVQAKYIIDTSGESKDYTIEIPVTIQ
ncbi:stalk domain-containing protein [Paenibacillus pini]|nr:stalk domain-containing protein [Paenibacillus pini]